LSHWKCIQKNLEKVQENSKLDIEQVLQKQGKEKIIEVIENHDYQSKIWPLTLFIWPHVEGQWPNFALETNIC